MILIKNSRLDGTVLKEPFVRSRTTILVMVNLPEDGELPNLRTVEFSETERIDD